MKNKILSFAVNHLKGFSMGLWFWFKRKWSEEDPYGSYFKETWKQWRFLERLIFLFNEIAPVFFLLTLLASSLITLYLIFFDNRVEANWPSMVAIYCCDVIYLIDYLIRTKKCKFRCHHRNRSNVISIDELPYKPQRCRNKLSKTLEIFSLIPLEVLLLYLVLGSPFGKRPEVLFAFALIRSNRLLRLGRIRPYFSRERRKAGENFYNREIRKIIIPFAFAMIIVYQIATCVWYALNCYPVYNESPPICTGEFIQRYLNVSSDNRPKHPFYSHVKLNESDPWGRYLGSLLWTVMNVRNTGNYYIAPANPWQIVISSTFMLFGFFVTCISLMFWSMIMLDFEMGRALYSRELKSVLKLATFLRMGYQVRLYLFYCFSEVWNRGKGFIEDIVGKLQPASIKHNVAENMFGPMVAVSDFLKTFSRNTLVLLSMKVELREIFPHDFIIRPGSHGDFMFYICSGQVEIIYPDESQAIMTLTEGSLVGEVNLLLPTFRESGVKAAKHCTILLLRRSDLVAALKIEPSARNRMQKIINKRLDFICPPTDPFKVKSNFTFREGSTLTSGVARKSVSTIVDLSSDSSSSSISNSTFSGISADEEKILLPLSYERKYASIFDWIKFEQEKSKPQLYIVSQFYLLMRPGFRNNASSLYYNVKPAVPPPDFSFSTISISRETLVYDIWSATIFLFILFNTLWYPISLILSYKPYTNNVNVMVDAIFFLDLVLRLLVFRYPWEMPEQAETLSIVQHIYNEFSVGHIWLDILAVVPFYKLASKKYYFLSRFYMLCKIHQVRLKIQKWEDDMSLKNTTVKVFKHSIYIINFCVYLACAFIWYRCNGVVETCVIESDAGRRGRYNFGDDGETALEVFLYWAMSLTFGVGFSDVRTISQTETIIHTFALLFGLWLVIYSASELVAIISASTGTSESGLKEAREWFRSFLKWNFVDFKLTKDVDKCLVSQWQIWRGIETDSDRRNIGFLCVSHRLYTELLIHSMIDTLYPSDFFKWMDVESIREICKSARLVLVPPRQLLVGFHDLVRNIYVIRRGVAEVRLSWKPRDGIHQRLREGKFIGFGEMVFGIPSPVEIRSVTHMELIVIGATSFERILGDSKVYREDWKRITNDETSKAAYMRKFKEPLPHDENPYKERRPFLPVACFPYENPPLHSNDYKTLAPDRYLEEWNGAVFLLKYFFRWITVRVTIIPDSWPMRAWNNFRAITLALTVFWTPILEVFPLVKKDHGLLIYGIIDGFTILDMYIHLHVTFYEPKLQVHPRRTVERYLSSNRFLFDVLGGPVVYLAIDYTIYYVLGSGFYTTIYGFILRLNRMILLYRLRRLDYSDLTRRHYTLKALKLIPVILFPIHLLCCLMALIACPAETPNYPEPRCKVKTWIYSALVSGHHFWHVSSGGNHSLSDVEIYVSAFYYTASTSFGCGFGDFLPASRTERALMAFTFFCCIFSTSWVLASIVSSKSDDDLIITMFQKEMKSMKEYFRREEVDLKCQRRLLRHYDYNWLRKQVDGTDKYFRLLFPSIKNQVCFHIFKKALSSIFPEMSSGFRRAICDIFQPTTVLSADFIVREGDVSDICYFVCRGAIICFRDGYVVDHMGAGGCIGNLEGPMHRFTATTLTQAELFAVSKRDLERVMRAFPEESVRLHENFRKPCRKSGESKKILSTASRKYSHKMGKEERLEEVENKQKTKKKTKKVQIQLDSEESVDPSESVFNSKKSNLQRQYLSEQLDFTEASEKFYTEMTKYDNPKYYRQCIIMNNNVWVKIMNFVIFMAAVVSIFLVSYQAAFKDFNLPMLLVGFLCDAIFIAKIILSFCISVRNVEGEFVDSVVDITDVYFGHFLGFTIDFLGTFPTEILAPTQTEFIDIWYMLCLLRLNRLFRIVEIWRFFRRDRFESSFKLSLIVTKFIRLFFLTGTYIHLAACVLQFYTVYNCGTIKPDEQQCIPALINTSWVSTKPETLDQHIPYTLTLYFTISIFTTTTYGDIIPVTPFEMVYISFVALSSKIWLGLALADILSGVQNTYERSYFHATYEAINLYKELGVPKGARKAAQKNWEHLWEVNQGRIIPQLILQAPRCIRLDILFDVYSYHLSQCFLFRGLDESFYRNICARMEHFYVLSDDYVAKAGTVDDGIYFIHRGFVKVFKVLEGDLVDEVKEEGLLNHHHYFGIESAIFGPRVLDHSYKAVGNVCILRISYENMNELFDWFPIEYEKIKRRLDGKCLQD